MQLALNVMCTLMDTDT